MNAGWTDAHAHPHELTDPEAALKRAASLGIDRVLGNTSHPDEWDTLAELSARHPQVLPGFGVHPWRVGELPSDWASQLTEALLRRPDAFVGEIGLDRKLTDQPMDLQKKVLKTQIDIANRLRRACTVHVVGAWQELDEVLKEVRPQRMLLHAFSGSPEQVKPFLQHRVWFSFGGAVIRQANSEKLAESVRAVPADRILLETDSPYQHPDGKEKEQEPVGLLRIAEAVAKLRGVPMDELKRQTEQNVEDFLTGSTGSTG